MSALMSAEALGDVGAVMRAADQACSRIAPCWPLDRFIAVNPFWSLVERPLGDVSASLAAMSGAQLLMPRAYYRDAYRRGALRDEHLEAAIAQSASAITLAHLRALLEEDEVMMPPRARVVDVFDRPHTARTTSWRAFMTQSLSQFCAAYFDDGQAAFNLVREQGLYGTWRRHASNDRSPELIMSARSYRSVARTLPSSADDMIISGLDALGVPNDEQAEYLWGLLLDLNGWASWCAYLRWTAGLEGRADDSIRELLAVRLAWEWMLLQMGDDGLASRWREAIASWPAIDVKARQARAHDWLLQSAMEIAFREPLLRSLPHGFAAAALAEPAVQAVFCIDVRSEIYRRALESVAPNVQTLGFAGFFGLPLQYQPIGAVAARPQLPGLLAPRLHVEDRGLDAHDVAARTSHLERVVSRKSLKTDAISTFAFVDAFGVAHAADLLSAGLARFDHREHLRMGLDAESDARRKPWLRGQVHGQGLDVEARAELALAMLRAMSLTQDFARLVLLAGHGSATRNNPHAAGLDCGACCGQTGEVNARVAVSLLNDPDVRGVLARRGVHLSPRTWFVAGLHNTTTDDVTLFDTDEVPPSHLADLRALRTSLEQASSSARLERAHALGLDGVAPDSLYGAVQRRTSDWAQVRSEWGLANNAAFVAAPRERCRHIDFQGRVFLHEYRHAADEGHAILEQIMTAPMVVAHWINFQYYASTVDPLRYGSGNKVLHNVVGGHLGVFEGNSGDLRIGLPWQSVHDGKRWVHTPLRLSVFIEAPRAAIDRILIKHPTVRALVDNAWLSLLQIDDAEQALYARQGAHWHRLHGDVTPTP